MRRAVLAAVLSLAAVVPQISMRGHAQAKPATMPPMTLKVGDSAPNFTLRDQNGKDVSLKDFEGKKSVALAFYVFAFTGG